MKISLRKILSIEFNALFSKKEKNLSNAMTDGDYERALYILNNSNPSAMNLSVNSNFLYTEGTDKKAQDFSFAIMDKISESMLATNIMSLLHGASSDRNTPMIKKLLELPQSKEIRSSDLLRAAVYALPENDPRIKEIESRRINYDFGSGDKEIWDLFDKAIKRNELEAKRNKKNALAK